MNVLNRGDISCLQFSLWTVELHKVTNSGKAPTAGTGVWKDTGKDMGWTECAVEQEVININNPKRENGSNSKWKSVFTSAKRDESVGSENKSTFLFVCFPWSATWRPDLMVSSALLSGKNFTFQIRVTLDYSCQLKHLQGDTHKAY